MIVLVEAVLQVVKAELMAAVAASHMVASLVLVDGDATLRAIHCTVLFLPILKLIVFLSLAALSTGM